MFTYIFIYIMYMYMFMYIFIYLYICMYIFIYLYICMYIYIYIYIYICILYNCIYIFPPPHYHYSRFMTTCAHRVQKVFFPDKVICVSQAHKFSLIYYVDSRESMLH